jgi:hypothetical protein
MPCHDPDRSEDAAKEDAERLRALTIALCLACKKLIDLDKLPKELSGWYRAHTTSDRARKELEEAEQNVETLRKTLAKQNLQMAFDHKLIVQRNSASADVQVAYTRERYATLQLLKLVKEQT